MKVINQEELFNLLATIDHATPIGLSALTEVRAKKTNNPYGRIFKLNKISAFAGIDYEANMNNALVKQGQVPSYDPSPRTYGTHLTSSIIHHKDNDYFACRVLKSRPLYMIRNPRGYLELIDKKKIEHLIPKDKKEIITYRNYLLSSIKQINIGKKQYKITNK